MSRKIFAIFSSSFLSLVLLRMSKGINDLCMVHLLEVLPDFRTAARGDVIGVFGLSVAIFQGISDFDFLCLIAI